MWSNNQRVHRKIQMDNIYKYIYIYKMECYSAVRKKEGGVGVYFMESLHSSVLL